MLGNTAAIYHASGAPRSTYAVPPHGFRRVGVPLAILTCLRAAEIRQQDAGATHHLV